MACATQRIIISKNQYCKFDKYERSLCKKGRRLWIKIQILIEMKATA